MGAVVHRPGEGEHVGGPSSVTIKATGEDTAGTFYLGEVVIEPGFAGPPPHVHERLHDMFYVLDGTLTMVIDAERVDLGPGSFVCVAPGTIHAFSNGSARCEVPQLQHAGGVGGLHARPGIGPRRWEPNSRGDRSHRFAVRLPRRVAAAPEAARGACRRPS